MNGVDVGNLSRADYTIGTQITVGAFVSPYANRLVGELHVKRLNVGLRVDREGLDAKLATGAHDPQGDFTAIGDEDFLNHQKLV
jgi:hypothetical protein